MATRTEKFVVWLVYKNGKYIGEVTATTEDCARAAALSKFDFKLEDDLSVSEK